MALTLSRTYECYSTVQASHLWPLRSWKVQTHPHRLKQPTDAHCHAAIPIVPPIPTIQHCQKGHQTRVNRSRSSPQPFRYRSQRYRPPGDDQPIALPITVCARHGFVFQSHYFRTSLMSSWIISVKYQLPSHAGRGSTDIDVSGKLAGAKINKSAEVFISYLRHGHTRK